MILERRIQAFAELGKYMAGDGPAWQSAKEKAALENGWFTPEFISVAVEGIVNNFLDADGLREWTGRYPIGASNSNPKTVGVTMAGNIPMVGFHDFLAILISGHRAMIKPSSKDQVLIRHIAGQLQAIEPGFSSMISFEQMLKGCDAYIATGSNNTSRYFEYYFGKYPHIIRRNKTSAAVLSGNESTAQLARLADDVHLFFGLGCRNVTKLYVPAGYDFIDLLHTFEKYVYLADHHKYKNNYDYNLALYILNNRYYMTNGSILLVEDPGVFAPISQLNFEYYGDSATLVPRVMDHPDVQAVVGPQIPFGSAQSPALADYADRVDTLEFLSSL